MGIFACSCHQPKHSGLLPGSSRSRLPRRQRKNCEYCITKWEISGKPRFQQRVQAGMITASFGAPPKAGFGGVWQGTLNCRILSGMWACRDSNNPGMPFPISCGSKSGCFAICSGNVYEQANRDVIRFPNGRNLAERHSRQPRLSPDVARPAWSNS